MKKKTICCTFWWRKIFLLYFKTNKALTNLLFYPTFWIGGIKQSGIVEWYIERSLDEIKTLDQADQLSKIVHSIIQRLITKE